MRSNKIVTFATSLIIALTLGTGAFAQTPTPAAPPPGAMTGPSSEPQHMKDPARHAAHEACKASVAKDAQGRPDHKAMKACMESKGFTPKHGTGGPPPGGPSAAD